MTTVMVTFAGVNGPVMVLPSEVTAIIPANTLSPAGARSELHLRNYQQVIDLTDEPEVAQELWQAALTEAHAQEASS